MVFPARAGVIPAKMKTMKCPLCLSRTSGGDSQPDIPPGMDGKVFPARAGVIPTNKQ